MQLPAIDIVFGVILVFVVLRATIRGFVKEFLSAAALIGAIALAVAFSGMLAVTIDQQWSTGAWSQVIAFLGIFVVVYLVIKFFETTLHRIVHRINLSGLDRALGLFVGIIEGIVVVAVLILLLQVQPFIEPEALLGDSIFARLLTPLFPYVDRVFRGRAAYV